MSTYILPRRDYAQINILWMQRCLGWLWHNWTNQNISISRR